MRVAAAVGVSALALAGCGASGPPAVICPPVAAAAGSMPSSAVGEGTARPAPGATEVRVNQVGYVARCAKLALLMSQAPRGAAQFTVVAASTGRVVLSGVAGPSRGAWSSAWPYVYPLDISALRVPGRYVITITGTRSPTFTVAVASKLYAPLAADSVRFFQAQRDGPDVIPGALNRAPSHLFDAQAIAYQPPTYRGLQLVGSLHPTGAVVNVLGGTFDAGDYLKFVETSSFDDALELFTLRDFPGGLTNRGALATEARFGIDWLLRMWDERNRVLYYQVGIGDGNGSTVLGDHDIWRLPQVDDQRNEHPGAPAYYLKFRPVFAANAPGGLLSPNLAGRVAAAFALCAQVFAGNSPSLAHRCLTDGESIYALADTHHKGALLTSSPAAYYTEPEWRSDMALGAVELFLATQALGTASPNSPSVYGYLNDAGRWANEFTSGAVAGQDSLNLYDVSAIADYDLVHVLRSQASLIERGPWGVSVPTDETALRLEYANELALGVRIGAHDPFRLSNTSTNLDTVAHALGYAIEARLYDTLIGHPTYEGLAQTELNWVLGENPWGTSFVVGAGTIFPHCLSHQIANLAGSLDGTGALLRGAVVDGPTDPAELIGRGAPDRFRPCPPSGGDAFSRFDNGRYAYLDDVTAAGTTEPSDDIAALALLAFAQAASAG